MSKVLDHCENAGRRHIRFRELAADVLGDVITTLQPSLVKARLHFSFLIFFLHYFYFPHKFIYIRDTPISNINNS